jgi:ABC-type multidrug transport system fused ATPase/permease subunit
MRLLFEFAEDYCLNFEGDVAALSERYQQIINAPKGETDPSSFLQAFHRLWIAMEDYVLAGFPPEGVQEGATEIAADVPVDRQTAGHPGALFDLKKALLFRSSRSRRPLVELKNVARGFGNSKSKFELGPVNLTVPQGQIVGVVGPNGAGKTTLLRLIAADLAQSSGEIDYPGLIS